MRNNKREIRSTNNYGAIEARCGIKLKPRLEQSIQELRLMTSYSKCEISKRFIILTNEVPRYTIIEYQLKRNTIQYVMIALVFSSENLAFARKRKIEIQTKIEYVWITNIFHVLSSKKCNCFKSFSSLFIRWCNLLLCQDIRNSGNEFYHLFSLYFGVCSLFSSFTDLLLFLFHSLLIL